MRESESTDSVKSVSLAELQGERPSPFVWLVRVAKATLMLWGALSLGAAAGTAAFYLTGTSGEAVLVTDREPARPRSTEEPVPERVAVAKDVGLSGEADAANAAPPVEIPEPIEARLPRPRPDEPITTGSINGNAYDSALVGLRNRERYDPCETWNSLGFPFRFHCTYQRRVIAPPTRPYYSPYVVR